jgi:FKBP-type peptidyl-prolyl cis-trans isomerase SlyD
MQIAKDTVVSMHYRVATAEGEHVDASAPGQPLVYLHGHHGIIPGLEAALAGKAVGDKVTAEVPPAQGYGEHDPGLDLIVEAEAFPADARAHLQPGFRFRAEHPQRDGEQVIFTVAQVEDNKVYVSGNHPLAGKTLNFQVEIAAVRAATAEELAHGHVHGAGGHHH